QITNAEAITRARQIYATFVVSDWSGPVPAEREPFDPRTIEERLRLGRDEAPRRVLPLLADLAASRPGLRPVSAEWLVQEFALRADPESSDGVLIPYVGVDGEVLAVKLR